MAGELAAVYSFVFASCCRCKSVMHLQQKWLAINLNLNGAPACVAKTVPAAWPSTTSTFTTTNIYWFSFSFLLSFGPFLCVFLRGPLICSSARQICCRTSSASGGKIQIDRLERGYVAHSNCTSGVRCISKCDLLCQSAIIILTQFMRPSRTPRPTLHVICPMPHAQPLIAASLFQLQLHCQPPFVWHTSCSSCHHLLTAITKMQRQFL